MFDIKNLSPQEQRDTIDNLPIYKKIQKLESLSFEMGMYEYDDRMSTSRYSKLSKQLHDIKHELINELVILYLIKSDDIKKG